MIIGTSVRDIFVKQVPENVSIRSAFNTQFLRTVRDDMEHRIPYCMGHESRSFFSSNSSHFVPHDLRLKTWGTGAIENFVFEKGYAIPISSRFSVTEIAPFRTMRPALWQAVLRQSILLSGYH